MYPSGECLKDRIGSMSSMDDVPSTIYSGPQGPASLSEPSAERTGIREKSQNSLQTATTTTATGERFSKEERGVRKVIRNFTPS